MFVNSVALKNQFTSKWAGSQRVMGDYNSPEQSIQPRPWEVTWHIQHYEMLSHLLLRAKYLRINKSFPSLKKTCMFTLDGIETHVTSRGLDQILYYHTLCLSDWEINHNWRNSNHLNTREKRPSKSYMLIKSNLNELIKTSGNSPKNS